LFRNKFTSTTELEVFLGANYDPVQIRPIGPRFRLSDTLLLVDDLRIWTARSATGFDVLASERPKRYRICLPSQGRTDARFGGKTESLAAGQGWIWDSESLDFIRRYEGYAETSFDIPREIVHGHLARAREWGAAANTSFEGVFDMSHGSGRLISRLISAMIEGVDNGMALLFSPFAARNFSNLVLDIFVHGTVLQEDDAGSVKARGAVVRAIDFVEANLRRPVTIMDMAEAAGVGPRALQMGFQRQFGCSPLKYARRLRLARVRQELINRADHEYITDIAARWGFFHLGLFARQYRETYGEFPSETKRA
jgi:AraC-like DNA-binding protein